MDLLTIQVDYDSPDEIKKLIQRLKSRFGEIAGSPSRKARQRDIYEACQRILAFDTSPLYDDTNSNPGFYVYAHLDMSKAISAGANPTTTFAATTWGMTHFPFYIGKGIGNRAYDVSRNETHRKIKQKLQRMGLEPKVQILQKGLTASQALQLEDKLIDIFGLAVYGGYLTNLDQGNKPVERMKLYDEDLKIIRGSAYHLYNKVDKDTQNQ